VSVSWQPLRLGFNLRRAEWVGFGQVQDMMAKATAQRAWRKVISSVCSGVMYAAVICTATSSSAQEPPQAPTQAPAQTAQQVPEPPAGVTLPPAQDGLAGTAAPAGTSSSNSNTTVVTRSGADGTVPGDATAVQVRLIALLTADGQKIDRDIVWRIFQQTAEQTTGKSKLVNTFRTPSPVLRGPPGDYVVNAAFGRANVTRKITLTPETAPAATERFVLNAGGMRVSARVAETAAPAAAITYSIYSDRDQSGERRLVIAGVKPGLIIRLNAGIYHIISTVGDANAVVESDVTVEAGKLTEANVAHAAAKATFKLVSRPGGEALAGTQWTIKTDQGLIVKESTGALPTHILAPGTYTAIARAQGKTLQRAFTVIDGQATQVEVIAQ
jgi:preprotein translocase subunit YajC